LKKGCDFLKKIKENKLQEKYRKATEVAGRVLTKQQTVTIKPAYECYCLGFETEKHLSWEEFEKLAKEKKIKSSFIVPLKELYSFYEEGALCKAEGTPKVEYKVFRKAFLSGVK